MRLPKKYLWRKKIKTPRTYALGLLTLRYNGSAEEPEKEIETKGPVR